MTGRHRKRYLWKWTAWRNVENRKEKAKRVTEKARTPKQKEKAGTASQACGTTSPKEKERAKERARTALTTKKIKRKRKAGKLNLFLPGKPGHRQTDCGKRQEDEGKGVRQVDQPGSGTQLSAAGSTVSSTTAGPSASQIRRIDLIDPANCCLIYDLADEEDKEVQDTAFNDRSVRAVKIREIRSPPHGQGRWVGWLDDIQSISGVVLSNHNAKRGQRRRDGETPADPSSEGRLVWITHCDQESRGCQQVIGEQRWRLSHHHWQAKQSLVRRRQVQLSCVPWTGWPNCSQLSLYQARTGLDWSMLSSSWWALQYSWNGWCEAVDQDRSRTSAQANCPKIAIIKGSVEAAKWDSIGGSWPAPRPVGGEMHPNGSAAETLSTWAGSQKRSTITPGSVLSTWAIRHSGWLLKRFQPASGQGGQTPYEIRFERRYAGKLVPFGSTIFARTYTGLSERCCPVSEINLFGQERFQPCGNHLRYEGG